jgi:hypothetical protein
MIHFNIILPSTPDGLPFLQVKKKEGKAIPVTGHGGP